jgi:hypothetical protein
MIRSGFARCQNVPNLAESFGLRFGERERRKMLLAANVITNAQLQLVSVTVPKDADIGVSPFGCVPFQIGDHFGSTADVD